MRFKESELSLPDVVLDDEVQFLDRPLTLRANSQPDLIRPQASRSQMLPRSNRIYNPADRGGHILRSFELHVVT